MAVSMLLEVAGFLCNLPQCKIFKKLYHTLSNRRLEVESGGPTLKEDLHPGGRWEPYE